MRETLGFPAVITRDNADELLEQMRIATADVVRRESASREEEMQTTHASRLAALTQEHQDRMMQMRAELMQSAEASARFAAESAESARIRDEQTKELSARLDAARAESAQDVTDRVLAAADFANAARRRLKVEIVSLYASIVLAALVAPANSILAIGVSLVIAVAGFWIVPQLIFEKPLDAIWLKDFHDRAESLLVQARLAEFDIDAHAGTARRK
jgi:hypothetical protein